MFPEPLNDGLDNWVPSEKRFLAAMVAEALLIVDMANIIVFVSERLTTLIGYTKADIVGIHLFELIISTDRQFPDPGLNAPEWSYYSASLATQWEQPLKTQIASRVLHDIKGDIIIDELLSDQNNPPTVLTQAPTYSGAAASRTR